jgi:hypothetical protein
VNVAGKGRFDRFESDELEGLRESRVLLLGMGLALILLGAACLLVGGTVFGAKRSVTIVVADRTTPQKTCPAS